MATVKYFVRSTSEKQKKTSKIRIRITQGREINIYGDSKQEIEPKNWLGKDQKVKDVLEITKRILA